MPQLIFQGVQPEQVQEWSQTLLSVLADCSNTPPDYFTFCHLDPTYYTQGQQTSTYPLVEIKLFDRGRDVEAKMARIISDAILAHGYEECEVYFLHLQQDDYYCF